MKTVIIGYSNPTKEGINLHLNVPTALNGGLKSETWFVSWDKVGVSLFGDKYEHDFEISKKLRGVTMPKKVKRKKGKCYDAI